MHPLSRLLVGASLAVGLALLMVGSDDLRVQATDRPVTREWSGQPPSNRAGNNPAARHVEANLAAKTRISEVYGRLPLSFEKNEGQTDSRVEFLSRGPGRALFLSAAGEAVLTLTGAGSAVRAPDNRGPVNGPRRGTSRPNTMAKGETARDSSAVLRLKPFGASRKAHAEGRGKLPGKVNYLRGNDRSQWHAGISTYARVAYENIYPGVDLVYYGNQRQLEYDFIVRPGVDPSVIALEAEGADRLEVDERGDLVMHVGTRQVRQQRPVVYQEVEGVRHELDGRYALQSSGRVTFQLGAYDPTLALVIDPVLVYSTYLGGGASLSSASDFAADVVVDSAGQAYVAGYTTSSAFSTTPGAYDRSHDGKVDNVDVFVTKLDAAGATPLYSTFLGGSGNDYGMGIAVDVDGHAYVTGSTDSSDFPTTPGAAYPTIHAPDATEPPTDPPPPPKADVFVTKLDTSGAMLAYSTFLGGAADDIGQGIAVNGMGQAYVTGYTYSNDFPMRAAYDGSLNGSTDAFVTKLDTTGATLVYSTFLGGAADDIGQGIAVNATDAYVTGYTSSDDFATTPGAYDRSFNGNLDVFVVKLGAVDGTPAYSTFLGGAADDIGQGVAIDSGEAYVTGYTYSSAFPTTPGAAYPTIHAPDATEPPTDPPPPPKADVFVTKLDRSGAMLVYSTFLGGADDDIGQGIAVNAVGQAYVTGLTFSDDFPMRAAYDESFNGSADVFVTKLDTTGATLVYSTFLGGANYDSGQGIAVDRNGAAYVAGYTSSSDSSSPFPTTADAYDTSFNETTESFVTKIGDAVPPPPIMPATLILTPPADVNIVDDTHRVVATVRDASGVPVPGVSVRFSVTGPNANVDSGSPVTDAKGEASFSYAGPLPGEDAIHAYADTNANKSQDPGEKFDDATNKWVLPTPAPACASVFGIGYLPTEGGHWAGFAFDVDQRPAPAPPDGELAYLAWGKQLFRATKILQLIITGNSATIHGLGNEYGKVVVPFRVDVTVGDPDTFRITWPGYTERGSVKGEIVISSKCGHDVHRCNGDFHHGDRGDH